MLYTIEELRVRQLVREELENFFSNDNSENKKLLTRKEAAHFLGIKENTLAVWASRNIGPAPTKIGSRVMYSRSELEAYVAENTMPRGEVNR